MSKLLIIAIILLGLLNVTYSQDFIQDCPHSQFISGKSSPQNVIGGLYKPQRIDVSGAPTTATLKTLIVFVQFANETVAADYWPIGGAPTYMNDLLAINKNSTGNYWDRYNQNTECLSDWFQEVSKGQLHVTGEAYNIVLDYDANHYLGTGLRDMNNEIISKLTSAGVRWQNFDYWSGSSGDFYYQPDDYIDMIIKVHRTKTVNGLFYSDAPGYACLGPDPWNPINIGVPGGKYINDGFSELGSGLTIVGTVGGPATKDWVFNIAKHEYGHFLFGAGHTTPGIGIMGSDIYLGAWESKKLGYLSTRIIDFSTPTQTLGDISSRNSSGEILQVPINGSSEYFLITNRRKVSHYDVTMLGDTSKGIWDRELSPNVDYGKGIYIYHYNSDLNFPSESDIECADGLWNWAYTGTTTPDWSSTQVMDVYERTTAPLVALNDNGYTDLYNKDGRSAVPIWFGRGKRHTVLGGEATDRIFTNDLDIWTSREKDGDRWDAFNIGYNEIFSPYSNPSSIGWNNTQSGLFVYYHALSGTDATMEIYKVGENLMTEDQILALTPPSKPMGIKHDYFYPPNGWCVPQITWNHNMEPDMERGTKSKYKRYEVWRVTAPNMSTVPDENYYTLLATVDIPVNITPHYEDYSVLQYDCADLDQVPPFGTKYPVRYRVKAVDNTDLVSVKSDFVSTTGITPNGGIGGEESDNSILNSNVPKEFNLSQNFPNPFNPVTKINFALPKQGFVSLKIYDITGREVQTLVSEVKQAGYYSVDFNGSSLSSGVYFYRIQSNNFVSVKRMVLIK